VSVGGQLELASDWEGAPTDERRVLLFFGAARFFGLSIPTLFFLILCFLYRFKFLILRVMESEYVHDNTRQGFVHVQKRDPPAVS
jgi:hypothetical protein